MDSERMQFEFDKQGSWTGVKIDPGYEVLDREFGRLGNETGLYDHDWREVRTLLAAAGISCWIEWVSDDDYYVLVERGQRQRAAELLIPNRYHSRAAGAPRESEADARRRVVNIVASEVIPEI